MYGNQGNQNPALLGVGVRQQGAIDHPDAPSRQSQISARGEDLARMTELLHQGLSMLENRLGPILTPSAPNAAGENTRASQSVPLAGFLADQADHVARANARISELMNRIEL